MLVRTITRPAAPILLALIAVAVIGCAGPASPASPTAGVAPTAPTSAAQVTPSTAPASPAIAPTAAPSPAATASPTAGSGASARTPSVAMASPSAGSPGPTTAATSPSAPPTPIPIGTPLTPTVAGTPATGSAAQAVQSVILRSDLAQASAFASGDPTAMKSTATSAFYSEMVQSNQSLANAGATSIRLVKLVWGSVAVQGTTARATTYETWLTTYQDDETELQENDQNVYDLVQTNGQWLVRADNHPASQSAGASGPFRRRPTPTPAGSPVPTVGPSTDVSRNWAGYNATGGRFTAVTGTWIVPHVNAQGATTVSTDASWVGIGGVTSRDLIQAGSQAEVVGPGDTVYATWIELLPAASQTAPLAVVPGDSLTVAITQTQTGAWSITLTNNTTGKSFQTTVQYRSSYSSAEWVEEAGSTGRRVAPLDNFGSVPFTNDTAVRDGTKVNLVQAGASAITMAGPSGQPLAVPSAIGGDGSSFVVRRI